VQTTTSDNILLQGYFNKGDTNKSVVLHIHGYAGNFYENYFVHIIDQKLSFQKYSHLTVNTRGAEYIKDFSLKGTINQITIGGQNELLEDAYRDIDAWIAFLYDEGYENIILQGHSLGTYKAVRYLTEGTYKARIKKLILLAPFDKKGLMQSFTKIPLKKLITKAQKEIDAGAGSMLVTKEFDVIPLSYKTWVSWYKQDDLGRIFEFCTKNYDFPVLNAIKIPVCVIVGSKDEYFHLSNADQPEEAINILKHNISTIETHLIKGAQHTFKNYEDAVAENILTFIY
jgi:alpha-beta hydrolase superfamily lysophospholipase